MTDNVVATAVGNQFFSDLLASCGEFYKYGSHKGMDNAQANQITPILASL